MYFDNVDNEVDRQSESNAPISEISDQGEMDMAPDDEFLPIGHVPGILLTPEGNQDKELLMVRIRRISSDMISMRSDLERIEHDMQNASVSPSEDRINVCFSFILISS